MIYFLQRENGDIKIGTTERYSERLPALERQYGKLTPLGFMEGSYAVERGLHSRFDKYRVERTEFFKSHSDLTMYISASTRPQPFAERRYVLVSKKIDADIMEFMRLLKHQYGVRNNSEAVREFIKSHDPDLLKAAQDRAEILGKVRGESAENGGEE